MPVYTVKNTCEAIDSKLSEEFKEPMYKTFEEGDVILADEYEKNDKYVLVSSRYILPKNVLETKTSKSNSDEKDESVSEVGIFEREKTTNSAKASVNEIHEKAKTYKTGLVFGAAAGLITALVLRKKVLWLVLGGALIGGHISMEMKRSSKPTHEII